MGYDISENAFKAGQRDATRKIIKLIKECSKFGQLDSKILIEKINELFKEEEDKKEIGE